MYYPFGISIYEQSLYWLMDTSGQLQSCKLYGKKSCEIINIGKNNVHKQFAILHISRQPVGWYNIIFKDSSYLKILCILNLIELLSKIKLYVFIRQIKILAMKSIATICAF